MHFDILLSGGHLIDPKNNLDGPMDLGLADGKVAALGRTCPPTRPKKFSTSPGST